MDEFVPENDQVTPDITEISNPFIEDPFDSPPPPHEYLKSKFQIGSCKGPSNFGFSTAVFHPDDVPAAKRLNKMAVKAWLNPEKINAARPHWNTRTTGATQSQINRTRINSEFDRSNMYRYNYRAEILPPKVS